MSMMKITFKCDDAAEAAKIANWSGAYCALAVASRSIEQRINRYESYGESQELIEEARACLLDLSEAMETYNVSE